MYNWLLKASCLVILMAFVVGGCGKVFKSDKTSQEEDLACSPDVEMLAVRGDYAVGPLTATGGLDAWTKVRRLDAKGIVTFYQPDDSFYLTEHLYEIYPWSDSIRISAQEPLSDFTWRLSRGRFDVLQGDEQADVSRRLISYRDYAEAILEIITAPVRFFDRSSEYLRRRRPVKIDGVWYELIERVYPAVHVTSENKKQKEVEPVEPYWSEVIFCQERDNSRVSLILLKDVDERKYLAVRGYNYEELSELGVIGPKKIEIFRTDTKGVLKDRLVTVDFTWSLD